jgi:hypothetical protein
MPVEKKESGKLRVCIDFRKLNRATPKDEYPMPIADTLINNASRNRIISFLDGNTGYNQIFMAEEDASCWGPSGSEGPQKRDLTMFLEYNTWAGTFGLGPFGLESKSQHEEARGKRRMEQS